MTTMKHQYLVLIVFYILTIKCSNSQDHKAINYFKQFCDSIKTYDLPFSSDQIVTKSMSADSNYSRYHKEYDQACGKIISKNFVTIIYCEMPVEGMSYRLDTYDNFGRRIDKVHFGGGNSNFNVVYKDYSVLDKEYSIFETDSVIEYRLDSKNNIIKDSANIKITKHHFKINDYGKIKKIK